MHSYPTPTVRKLLITGALFALVMTWSPGLTWAETPAESVPTVRIGGSNTVGPLLQALLELYVTEPDAAARPVIDCTGTGDGLQRMLRGDADLVGASRPINQDELLALSDQVVEIPIAYDEIVVFVSSNNDFVDYLTAEELREIFLGGAERWTDVRASWPDLPIRPEAPEQGSGTTEALIAFIDGNGSLADRVRQNENHEEAVYRAGVGSDGIGFASAFHSSLTETVRSVPIDMGEGPQSAGGTPFESEYAFGRPLLLYLPNASLERDGVAHLVEFILENVANTARAHHFSPLPRNVRAAAERRWRERVVGSVLARGAAATAQVYGVGD
ncbi:MAG: substrate-binding domain-containing protein [Acidobacteriota bacterium]